MAQNRVHNVDELWYRIWYLMWHHVWEQKQILFLREQRSLSCTTKNNVLVQREYHVSCTGGRSSPCTRRTPSFSFLKEDHLLLVQGEHLLLLREEERVLPIQADHVILRRSSTCTKRGFSFSSRTSSSGTIGRCSSCTRRTCPLLPQKPVRLV